MVAQPDDWQDEARVRRYSRQFGLWERLVYAPFARQIVAFLPPSELDPIIVDLGCGQGQLAIELLRRRPQAHIIGMDPSGEMLRISRQNASRAGLSNYEARQGSAEEIPLESGIVDLVVSQSSFHEWEDQKQGLAEIYRVLQPGGSLILKDYNLGWLAGWKRRLLGRIHPLEMFKFGTEEVAALMGAAGFEQIQAKGKGMQYFIHARKR